MSLIDTQESNCLKNDQVLLNDEKEENNENSEIVISTISNDPPKQSWLLRLFESKLFNMSIAITYLYNSKESGLFLLKFIIY